MRWRRRVIYEPGRGEEGNFDGLVTREDRDQVLERKLGQEGRELVLHRHLGGRVQGTRRLHLDLHLDRSGGNTAEGGE